MSQNIFYGLRHKNSNEVLRVEKTITSDISGNNLFYAFTLSAGAFNSNYVWVVDSQEIAQQAKTSPISESLSYYNKPYHSFNQDELEVISFTVNTQGNEL